MALRSRLVQILWNGMAYAPLLIILYMILSLFLQAFSKTMFLPGGRASIEYLLILGYSERYGYQASYTFYRFLAMVAGMFVGDMLVAVRSAVIFLLLVYFLGLYWFSSLLSSRFLAAATLLTAFHPMFYDTVFKGDYALLAAMAFTCLLLAGICGYFQKPSKRYFAAMLSALVVLPFTDPQLLTFLSIVVLASLSAFVLSLGRRFSPHFLCLLSVHAAAALLSFTVSVGFVDGLWRPNPFLEFSSNIVISAFLVVSFGIGLLDLYVRGQVKLLFVLSSWLLASLVCVAIKPLSFAFLLPLASALMPLSLRRLKETFAVRRIGEDDGSGVEYEVEIDLGRLIAALPAMLLIVLLVLAAPSAVVLGDHEIVPPLKAQDIGGASSILSGEAGRRLIVAHPSLANWLLVSSGLNVLPVINEETFRVADLLTTTSFRMMNSFLKVDDWEPFSAAKAPLIHAYDGRNFRQLVYIDDSYARVTLVDSSGNVYVESPYRAKFLSHHWSRSDRYINLTVSFRSSGLIINKTITLVEDKPLVSVEYSAQTAPMKDVSVKRLSIGIYSLPMDVLPDVEVWSRGATVRIEGFKVSISFVGNVSEVSQGRTKDQRYVTCTFESADGFTVYGRAEFEVQGSVASGERFWYSSLFDEAKKRGVDYLIVPREHRVFMEGALPSLLESLILKDSFVRFIINCGGSLYIEAPAYAKVLKESVHNNSRLTLIETAGLRIEKKTCYSDTWLNVTYLVEPYKENTRLIVCAFSLWVAYGREVFSEKLFISIDNGSVRLPLDSGDFLILFSGNVSDIKVERHPEYGQIRVHATFQLQSSGDTIGVSIRSIGDGVAIYSRYEPTSRPDMLDEDRIIISVEKGYFEPAGALRLYEIYEVRAP